MENLYKIMKHLIIFCSIAFVSSNVLTQDFDDAFLESLPEEIREELESKADERDEMDEPKYRSTFIDRDEETIELIELSDRFGLEIFSKMQSTFMPLNEANIDGSYILDFGDLLELQIIGQKSLSYELSVKRDGSVSIPDIGKIFISGLSLEKASVLIQERVESSFIDVSSFVTLKSIRDIQIIVAGEVFNPGIYTLNGNSNVFHALSVAGGPSIDGSFRNINLIRQSEVIESLDLYETFIFGRPSFGSRLQSGDVVFVEHASNLVRVSGAVKKPLVYELNDDEQLDIAIKFSGGLTRTAKIDEISLFRFGNQGFKKRRISGAEELKTFDSKDGDHIYVSDTPYNTVTIDGAVNNPGTYTINKGVGLLELVDMAGGYTENAYPFGGILQNESTRLINEMAVEKLYDSFIDSVTTKASFSPEGSSSLESLSLILRELEDAPISGRKVIEFDVQRIDENPSLDTNLEDLDQLFIPEKQNQVFVYGEVLNQGAVKFLDEMATEYYVNRTGGMTPNADPKNIFILYPNGVSEKARFNKNLFMTQNRKLEIYPGSIIFVPRNFDDGFIRTQALQAYATIIGNLGVSLASLSVLKD